MARGFTILKQTTDDVESSTSPSRSHHANKETGCQFGQSPEIALWGYREEPTADPYRKEVIVARQASPLPKVLKESKMISIGVAELIFILLLVACCVIGVRIFRRRH